MVNNKFFYNHKNIHNHILYLKKTQNKKLKNQNCTKYTILRYNEYIQRMQEMNDWLFRIYKNTYEIINLIKVYQKNINSIQNINNRIILNNNQKKCSGSICSFNIDYNNSTQSHEKFLCDLCKI